MKLHRLAPFLAQVPRIGVTFLAQEVVWDAFTRHACLLPPGAYDPTLMIIFALVDWSHFP